MWAWTFVSIAIFADRLMVGQRTLNPSMKVRSLLREPWIKRRNTALRLEKEFRNERWEKRLKSIEEREICSRILGKLTRVFWWKSWYANANILYIQSSDGSFRYCDWKPKESHKSFEIAKDPVWKDCPLPWVTFTINIETSEDRKHIDIQNNKLYEVINLEVLFGFNKYLILQVSCKHSTQF